METMTPVQESRLLKSIERAIGFANGGMDPSEAIAKVAQADNYPWDFTSRMIEAFNASKTMKWIRTTQGEEKAASFAIADPNKVRGLLYPDTVPTPGEKQAAAWVPPECTHAETEFFASAEKKGSAVQLGAPQMSWERRDLNMLFTKAVNEVSALERQAKEAQTHVAVARARFDTSLNKLASYFRQISHEPFEQVEKVASATWDNVGKLMDIVWELSRAGRFGEKRASGPVIKTLAPDREPYTLIEDVLEKRAAVLEFHDRFDELVEKAEAARARLTELEHRCAVKSAGMDMGSAVMGTTQEFSPIPAYEGGPDLGKVRTNVAAGLADPGLVADNQAMDAQLTLHQLMTQDPVLSSRDPSEVINAFNMLSKSSPNLVQSPLALQAMLRKYLEAGGLDAMDISNMATTDKAMGSNQMRGDRMMAG